MTERRPLLDQVRLAVGVRPLIVSMEWVLTRAGGTGCVREFCDAVWEAQHS